MKGQATRQNRTTAGLRTTPRVTPAPHSVAAQARPALLDEKKSCVYGGGCPGCRDSLPALTKRVTGASGDRYEQEADRVARDIVSTPTSAVSVSRTANGMPQRARPHGHSASDAVSYATVPRVVQEVLRSPGRPLDPSIRAFMEPRFRRDLSDVRVHTDTSAATSARAVNALAYTTGNHIVFRQGYYAPQTDSGRRLLTHELTHTIQQRGAVEPMIQRREVCDDTGTCQSAADPEPNFTPNVAAMAGASLLPPGDCTPAEHRVLQDTVNATCKGERRCTQNDDCSVIWQRIEDNAACIKARSTINARCFRGGDLGPTLAVVAAVGALANCWAVYNRKCQPKPPFVPVPIPVPVEKPKPVVDKGFMERMAAITGLTGTALIIYLIISEGTRAFPPRNLIPVP